MIKVELQNEQQRVIMELIHLYRKQPCLWMIKSDEYRDRSLKDAAYEGLVQKLREIDANADREAVVKTINRLRTSYRREKRRLIENPKRRPRLWYFDLFNFLEDEDRAYSPFPDLVKEENSLQEVTDSDDGDYDDPDPLHFEAEPDMLDEAQDNDVPESLQIPNEYKLSKSQHIKTSTERKPGISYGTSFRPMLPAPTKLSQNPQFNKAKSTLHNKSGNYALDNEEPPVKYFKCTEEDRHAIFGRNIATKLRYLEDKKQRLLAEKLINDALFMAELGELTLDHSITNFHMATIEEEYNMESVPQYANGVSRNRL